jgi:hypothetical protein
MRHKKLRRKRLRTDEHTESDLMSKIITATVFIIAIGSIWGVGYLVGHEALGYSRLTSVLLAPAFFLLLIIILWFVRMF